MVDETTAVAATPVVVGSKGPVAVTVNCAQNAFKMDVADATSYEELQYPSTIEESATMAPEKCSQTHVQSLQPKVPSTVSQPVGPQSLPVRPTSLAHWLMGP